MIKKKQLYLVFLLIITGIISFSIFNVSNADEVEQEGFSLECEENEINKGEDIILNVKLNANEVDGFLVLVKYDKDLELMHIEQSKLIKGNGVYSKAQGTPEDDDEDDKKSLSFGMIINEDARDEMVGSNVILTLAFSTENCERGKTYSFEIDDSLEQVIGARSYIMHNSSRKSITNENASCLVKRKEISEEIQALGEESALNEQHEIVPLTDEEIETLSSAYIKGNAYDEDDILDTNDALTILEFYTHNIAHPNDWTLTKKQLYVYDVTENGVADVDDAQYLIRYVNPGAMNIVDKTKSIKENVDAWNLEDD